MLPSSPQLLWTPPAASSSFDAATTTWVANVFAVDSTVVGATQKSQVDTLIKSLKANGVFSTWDALWLLCCDNLTETKVDIVNGKIWTIGAGTPTLVTSGASGGISMSAGGWLNSGVNFSTAAQFARTSGTLAAYITVADTSSCTYMGASTSGTSWTAFLTFLPTTNRLGGGINDLNGDFQVKTTHNNGNLIYSRTAAGTSGEAGLIFDAGTPSGDPIGATGDSDQPVQSANCYIFARNDNGVAASTTAATLSMVGIGAGLDTTHQTNFASAMNTYMTARTCNVY